MLSPVIYYYYYLCIIIVIYMAAIQFCKSSFLKFKVRKISSLTILCIYRYHH